MVAPKRRAISSRKGFESTAKIWAAPIIRAPACPHNPIGPCAKTATLSPSRTPPLSAAAKPVEAMSASSKTCSSVNVSGMSARFACANGSEYSACVPSTVFPNRHPPSAPPHWDECPPRQGSQAARSNRTEQYALSHAIACHARAKFMDGFPRPRARWSAPQRSGTRLSQCGYRFHRL